MRKEDSFASLLYLRGTFSPIVQMTTGLDKPEPERRPASFIIYAFLVKIGFAKK